MTYGGTGYDSDNPNAIPARFIFPRNSDPFFYGTSGIEVSEWTFDLGQAMIGPQDIRGLLSTGPFTSLPGAEAEVDVAFVFGRDYTGSGNLAPILIMKERIDSIQSYYLSGQTPCGNFKFNYEKFVNDDLSIFSVYPNPFSDFITLDNQSSQSMEIVIYNLLGKELMRQYVTVGKTRINLSQIQDNALIIKAISVYGFEAKKLLRIV